MLIDPGVWDLAVIIYEARRAEAYDWGLHQSIKAPDYRSYTHKPTADMDLAIASAKAVLKAGYNQVLKEPSNDE